MTKILVLRHAATEWSAAKRLQGQRDLPLSAVGRRQVAAWRLPAPWLAADCVCSPLERARETAVLLGLTDRADERLIEMDWGRFEGRTLAELRLDPTHRMAENEAAGLDFRPPGGESPREVAGRIAPMFDAIGEGDRDQIWITHKGVRNACLMLATGWRMRTKPPIRLADDQGLLLDKSADRGLSLAGVVDLLRDV